MAVTDSGLHPSAFGGDIRYSAAGTPDIRFGHHFIDGIGQKLAHAFEPFPETDGLSGDVHFDSEESWRVNPPNFLFGGGAGFDFLEVAVHEIGHSLGLDHEPLPSEGGNVAILNRFHGAHYSGLGTAFLFEDDINGIKAIYGAGVGSVTNLSKEFIANFSTSTQGVTTSRQSSSNGATGYFQVGGNRVSFFGIQRFEVTGSDQNDSLKGWNNNDTLEGGAGHDRIYGYDGNDTLDGGTGNDRIYGHDDNDTLDGGNGKDSLYGGNDKDYLYGEDGNDRLYGHNGNDRLYGQNGSDYLDGGAGNDILIGGAYRGSEEIDTLTGDTGADRFVFGDRYSVFYDSHGNNDYAIVTDFQSGLDTIELHRPSGNYTFQNNEIYYQGDLLAQFQIGFTTNDIVFV